MGWKAFSNSLTLRTLLVDQTGGFIETGCMDTVFPQRQSVDPQNYLAMVQAGHAYGLYE